tara:strand:+ start:2815 stop:3501 length:687 start_codon:yes stop_codon:yes gene_type:complete
MQKLGTNYGGWVIPKQIQLTKDSLIYSVGVGEDISFDLLVQDKYNSNIVLIDPTKRAKKHYEEIKKYYKTHIYNFSGDIQKDYEDNIKNLNIDFSKITYNEIGVWDEKTELKFYKQINKNYVSQSLINGMFTNEYDIVKVDTLKNIMKKNNHTKIDLLKMDIEGAEIKVLNNMLDDNIFPEYLCIEFDLYLKGKDRTGETNRIVKKLLSLNYKILANDNMNITFKQFK